MSTTDFTDLDIEDAVIVAMVRDKHQSMGFAALQAQLDEEYEMPLIAHDLRRALGRLTQRQILRRRGRHWMLNLVRLQGRPPVPRRTHLTVAR